MKAMIRPGSPFLGVGDTLHAWSIEDMLDTLEAMKAPELRDASGEPHICSYYGEPNCVGQRVHLLVERVLDDLNVNVRPRSLLK